MQRVKLGIVGIGVISGIYLENLTTMFKDIVEIVAVCDLIPERATAAKEKYNIPKAYFTDEEIMADNEIELILNLTTPDQHFLVNEWALKSGKHVYCEKPLSVTREDGLALKNLAAQKGLYAGGAPDTFLGGGIQTCKKLIEEGWIGDPIGVSAFMIGHGHESWHPAPEFYYKKGAGPMFDMGPYYLTCLINLMGPIKEIAGATRMTFPTRTITSQPLYGKVVDVEIPTHVIGILHFESGAIGTLITSFDVWAKSNTAPIEIYGTQGSIRVPDPNTFGGPIEILRAGASEWETVPVVYGYQKNSRGLGVCEMAAAIRAGRKARAGIELTYHVLDAMHAFHNSSDDRKNYTLLSACTPAPLLPLGLRDGQVEG